MIFPIPYLVEVAILEICACICAAPSATETNRKYSIFVAITTFFVFFAFRGFIFSDWIIYYQYFYHCEWSDIFKYKIGSVVSFEPGFTILNLLCKNIANNYFFFQAVICLINLILLLNFFKQRTNNIPLGLTLYFVFGGVEISTNLLRNSISIMLFLNALPYLKNRKIIPYFSLCLLGASFHSSALIYLPLYFFFHKKLNKWIFLVVIIICNLIFLLKISVVLSVVNIIGLDQQFAEKLKAYTELFNKATPLSIGYIERLFTSILVFTYYKKIQSEEFTKDGAIIINAFLAYLIAFFFFSEFDTLSKRIGMLFIFSYWIIWKSLMDCFNNHNNRELFKAFVYFYCLIKIWSMTQLPSMEYDNILFGHKSYQERLMIFNRTFKEP